MEMAVGAASGLIGSVLNQLSDEFVEAYVASSQLSLKSDQIKEDLMFTQGLLHEAQRRGVSDNPGLQGLVRQLSGKADEAEDALDELHYFIIQDQLDGTKYTEPDLGYGLCGHACHGRQAVRHTVGNWLTCFSCSRKQDDGVSAVTNTTNPGSGNVGPPVAKLSFDRVAMSKKIKLVIEEMHSLCEKVSKLVSIIPHRNTNSTVTLRRPHTGSTTTQNTLYGREAIFERTLDYITTSACHTETLSVLPIVGPGGIGKTTFSQHLYNDKRTEEHFDVRVWVCVSTDFDVPRLTKQIHDRLPAIEKKSFALLQNKEKNEESNTCENQTTDLDQLQLSIAQKLESKRFLIVFDDIWECNSEGWENLLAPFMKGEVKGNMVLVTTRFPSKADMVKTTDPITLKGLDPDDFLTFFEAFIFGGNKSEDCLQNDLIILAREIAKKLKGSPLAAKTVGRLLKKELSWEHWIGVLENNEWQKQKNAEDIMPSLRISYDYLPFHLKKCFQYFALFPEDYKFYNSEITCFWIAIGIIEKDENYMEELVENGFLMKGTDSLLNQYYVLHDLLHELSRSFSSQECLNIHSSSSFRADAIPRSIRYLSITMEDRYEGNFRGEMVKLRSKIDIANLRALMIFREYEETIDEILKDTFKEIEGLRVLFLAAKSQESLPNNFPKLIHLRFLKITRANISPEMILLSTLSKLYHLIFLDLRGFRRSYILPQDISRLINLRHFFAENELHSNISEVGKMKCLQELKEFSVKKESVGFELRELGELTNLGGELRICNLENVVTKEDSMEAKLVLKKDLKCLTLVWGKNQHSTQSDVLDGFEPHPSLEGLVIENHGGSTGPSWLCGDISTKMLVSVTLDDVSWFTLPSFGQLPHLTSLTLKNIDNVREIGPGFGSSTDKSFMHLKKIVLDRLPKLIKWVAGANAHSFSKLEEICCSDCPNLCALPFIECSGSYTHLSTLKISGCPKLSIPLMPHTSSLTHIYVKHDPHRVLRYKQNRLYVSEYKGALALHNLSKAESADIKRVPHISLTQFGKLKSLTRLVVDECNIMWNFFLGGTINPFPTSLQELVISKESNIQLMALLSNLTSLTQLELLDCKNLTADRFNPLITAVNPKNLVVGNDGNHPCSSMGANLLPEVPRNKLLSAGSLQLQTLVVNSISAVLVAPICSLLAATLHSLRFSCDQRVESLTEEEEKALQLLTSLQLLCFYNCWALPSLPRGLHSLSSLRELQVCGSEIQSLPKWGLPTSLEQLFLMGCNADLNEQAKILEETNPGLRVDIYY